MGTRTRHEVIGRAAMAAVAGLLLWGAWGLLQAGREAGRHDAAIVSKMESGGVKPNRYPHVAGLMYAGSGLLGLAGLVTLRYAVGSHKSLFAKTPKPAVLWDNPTPGTGVRRF